MPNEIVSNAENPPEPELEVPLTAGAKLKASWRPLQGVSSKAKKLYKDSRKPGAAIPAYVCNLCEAAYNGKGAELEHKTNHNNDVKNNGVKPSVPCPQCEKTFSGKKPLKVHMKQIHGDSKPFICSNCHGVYTMRQTFLIHLNNTGFRYAKCKEVWEAENAKEQEARAVDLARKNEVWEARNVVIEKDYLDRIAKATAPPTKERYDEILNTF